MKLSVSLLPWTGSLQLINALQILTKLHKIFNL
jgi:hypothetical protein